MSNSSFHFIRLDPQDNVVVARDAAPSGTPVPGEAVVLREDVPAGHKVATRRIARGEPVLKYATTIGYAAHDVLPGSWMHNHNIAFDDVGKDYRYGKDYQPTLLIPEASRPRFMGYPRSDGRVGTRNYVGVFLVGRQGGIATRRIARSVPETELALYANVDGVVPFVHSQGNGSDLDEEARAILQRTLAGTIQHPNIGAALLVVYDRQAEDLDAFMRAQGFQESRRLRVLDLADASDPARAQEHAHAMLLDLMAEANAHTRQSCCASNLALGLQCGGSDGFSGLSANPALGAAVDILVRNGGTAILSETSEIYGVEHTLTARAASPAIGSRLVRHIAWWLDDNRGRDTQINGKVGPGNNAGGITNVIEKSLGGAKKAGSTGLMDVLDYAQPLRTKGFVFMDTPGNDPISVTGQIAGGANLVCFTTGRGSCFGSYPAPTVKLASNTPMFLRMRDDMDVNCGPVIDGEATVAQMGERIFASLLEHASGLPTRSEAQGIGTNEFIPWTLRRHHRD